ncbi:MAG: LysE family translocator, partial [Actinomycetota bacterium]|nr:LysE family translocator [Actinomycetota bacterium]
MPDVPTLAVFVIAGLTLLAIPGPNHVYIATRSAEQGRAAGFASAFGVEAGTLVHVCAASAGLSALIASSTLAFEILRYMGAAYLAFLGIRALRARPMVPADAGSLAPTSRRKLFCDGMLVNLLNPKVALFFLALLPQFIDPARGSVAGQTLVLGLVLAALGLATDLLYAAVAAAIAGRVRSAGRG